MDNFFLLYANYVIIGIKLIVTVEYTRHVNKSLHEIAINGSWRIIVISRMMNK